MERNWLQHCASKEQLTMAIDRVDAAAHGLKPHQTMAKFRTIFEDGLFLDLPDND